MSSLPKVGFSISAGLQPSEIVEAVVRIGLDDTAKRLVQAISRPEMAEKGYSESSPGWTNENALRAAIKKTGRNKILALEHGFHGRTAAAVVNETVRDDQVEAGWFVFGPGTGGKQ